jgi:hypothetical protein
MSDVRTVKEVLLRKPDGRRRRRAQRQNLIWLDRCEKDLKLMGVKGWKEKAEDSLYGPSFRGRQWFNGKGHVPGNKKQTAIM